MRRDDSRTRRLGNGLLYDPDDDETGVAPLMQAALAIALSRLGGSVSFTQAEWTDLRDNMPAGGIMMEIEGDGKVVAYIAGHTPTYVDGTES